MDPVRPQEHWPGTVRPLLKALAPRAVWAPGEDELSELVRRAGEADDLHYDVAGQPGEQTEATVISGDPNHYWVSQCISAALEPGVGGDGGPPLIVVSATGWPHGERDGYLAPERIPAGRRRAYARFLPDPDERWLTAEVAPLAFALEPGGRANGVRTAVDELLARGGWEARLQEGFGGLAVLVERSRLEATPALAAVWEELDERPAPRELLRRLDMELGRAALARARLEHALAQERATNERLRAMLSDALDALELDTRAEEERVRAFAANLERVATKLKAVHNREHRLEHRATAAEAQAAAARSALSEEREWVAAQARLIARSQAWRVGHRIARTAWLLRFRRQRGDDALQRMIARMERDGQDG